MITRDIERRFYIPEIDGLRALAVLAVMIYHLVPSSLPGGFSGVDVFFVISGFVVAGSMSRDAALPLGKFILAFYARRFRRIVPALVVCLSVTVFFSVALIPESWLSTTLKVTGLCAFFGISNFTLAAFSDGYFDTRTEFNPFTHTWSLAVEEQFYVLFPLLAYLIIGPHFNRVTSGVGRRLLYALTAGSLLWCAVATRSSPDSAYYLLPSRFWELGSGAMLFLVGQQWRARFVTAVGLSRCTIGGLVLIVTGFLLARPDAFPFPWALVPVMGALLVVTAATCSSQDKISRLLQVLGSRQLVYIGLLSYSLYLWHWPVYTLLRWTIGLESVFMYMLALVGTWILASASYYLVERPAQTLSVIRKLPNFATVLSGIVIVVMGWGGAQLIHWQSWRIKQTAVEREGLDWSPYWRSDEHRTDTLCQSNGTKLPLEGRAILPVECKDVLPASRPTLFVAGDSHAGAYVRMLDGLVRRSGVAVHLFSRGGCAVGGTLSPLSRTGQDCREFHAGVIKYIFENGSPGDLIFLPSLRVERISYQDGVPPEKLDPAVAKENGNTAEKELLELSRSLSKVGFKVIVELPKPVFRAPPFRCADSFNHMNPICRPGFSIERDFMEQHRSDAMSAIRRVAVEVDNVFMWDPLPELCSASTCEAFDGRRPLFFDADHLSGHGNERLLPSFEAFMTSITTRP